MGFKIDRPIENSGEDLLNRSKFAKYVADAIASLNDEHHGTVIGIQGHWGCGKTSLAKMVEQELQTINGQSKKSIKKMKFLHLETWLATDRETLIKEFFTLILNAVDNEIDKDGKLHLDIKKYANEFGRRLIRSASFGFQPCGIGINFDGAELIGPLKEPSLDEQKQKINMKLGQKEMIKPKQTTGSLWVGGLFCVYCLTLLDKQGRNALNYIRKSTTKVETREKEEKICFMIIC